MFLHLQIDSLELFRVIGVKIDKNQDHSFKWLWTSDYLTTRNGFEIDGKNQTLHSSRPQWLI